MILLHETLLIDFVVMDKMINKSKNILKKKRHYLLILLAKQEINI